MASARVSVCAGGSAAERGAHPGPHVGSYQIWTPCLSLPLFLYFFCFPRPVRTQRTGIIVLCSLLEQEMDLKKRKRGFGYRIFL